MKAPLTKSLFMKGLPCEDRLVLTLEQEDNKHEEDSFLKTLAQGGFQVEALARMQYPQGIFIDTKHGQYEKAAKLTKEALEQENVVLFEAAFLVDGYFVRTDILEKKGNKLKIIEVKAKSFAPGEKFLTRADTINRKWEDKLWDLTFQKFVVGKSFPEYEVEAAFLFADKTKKASINGMNQMFRIPADGNPRTEIQIKADRLDDLGDPILIEVNGLDEILEGIYYNRHRHSIGEVSFDGVIRKLKGITRGEHKKEGYYHNIYPNFRKCKNCEFRTVLREDGGTDCTN